MIRHLKPKVVVALGEIAAWALTGDGKLTDRMGEPLPNDCSAAPVLITYRPAYALHARDEAIAALIAEHIQAAARLLTAGSIAE
jgi:uracil-DNA glycosylase